MQGILRQRVRTEQRGIICPYQEGGLAKEHSWVVPGACTVVASMHTCPGN